MSDPKAPFGSTEIEILRYIGDHHPISVGEMAEYVAGTTGQARTTVLTIMDGYGGRAISPARRSAAFIATRPRSPSKFFCKLWCGTSWTRPSAVRCLHSWRFFPRAAPSPRTTWTRSSVWCVIWKINGRNIDHDGTFSAGCLGGGHVESLLAG